MGMSIPRVGVNRGGVISSSLFFVLSSRFVDSFVLSLSLLIFYTTRTIVMHTLRFILYTNCSTNSQKQTCQRMRLLPHRTNGRHALSSSTVSLTPIRYSSYISNRSCTEYIDLRKATSVSSAPKTRTSFAYCRQPTFAAWNAGVEGLREQRDFVSLRDAAVKAAGKSAEERESGRGGERGEKHTGLRK